MPPLVNWTCNSNVWTFPRVGTISLKICRCGTSIPSRYLELFDWRMDPIQWQLPSPCTEPFVSFCAHCLKSVGVASVNFTLAIGSWLYQPDLFGPTSQSPG